VSNPFFVRLHRLPLFRHLAEPVTLDIVERAATSILYGIMTLTFLRSWQEHGQLTTLLLLFSEGTVTVFVILRRFTRNFSMQPLHWAFAAMGTLMPLLARPAETGPLVPVIYGVVLMILGLVLQISSKCILARSFGIVPANRGVKSGGPYRFVRHPIYAGYLLTQCGFLLLNSTLWNATIYSVALLCQIARMRFEEEFLQQDPAYREMMRNVPYKLVPGLY
jgi:protein-S-isoprenylcysteine O-methyltransferase Ste14